MPMMMTMATLSSPPCLIEKAGDLHFALTSTTSHIEVHCGEQCVGEVLILSIAFFLVWHHLKLFLGGPFLSRSFCFYAVMNKMLYYFSQIDLLIKSLLLSSVLAGLKNETKME